MVERYLLELKSWQKEANCTNCNREFITSKYRLKENNNGNVFCSRKCYNEFRSKYYVGDKASVYKKIKTNCSCCNKEILVPPNKFDVKNKDGENHIFCSRECYYKFRSEYYVGDKLYNTGNKMSKDFCDKVRKATLKQYANGVLNRQTIPQKIVNNLLDELNIKYTNEKTIGYYSVDNYLDDYNLIIEVMGDYFHTNPNKYNVKDINDMQHKDIIRDKRKHTYIKKHNNIEILYLWENEIKTDAMLCKKLIKKYVQNNGRLDDYNSFNFFIYDNKLKLKNNIINPYFISPPND